MVKLPGYRNDHIHISMRATNDNTHFHFIQSSFISYRDKEIYLKIKQKRLSNSQSRERARDRQRKKERQKERLSSVSTRPTGVNVGMSDENKK